MYGSWSVLCAAFLSVQLLDFCLSSVRAHCLSSRSIFDGLVHGFIVCLASSYMYNGPAPLALAPFARVRALRAWCVRFAPAVRALVFALERLVDVSIAKGFAQRGSGKGGVDLPPQGRGISCIVQEAVE